jgi:hypothetical protein
MLELRPEVAAFAQLMEAKLRENDHKGGWQHDGTDALLKRLREEADELQYVTETSGAWCSAPPRSVLNTEERIRVAREAADVANFAMMIADVCGGLADNLRAEKGGE